MQEDTENGILQTVSKLIINHKISMLLTHTYTQIYSLLTFNTKVFQICMKKLVSNLCKQFQNYA